MFKKLLIAAMFALAACSGPAPAYAAIETMTPRMIVEAQNPQCLSPDVVKATMIQATAEIYVEIITPDDVLKFKQHLSVILDQ